MYTKSENLQALQSQHMITDALLLLMNKHSYNDITITQICQEAKVVRQTFYRNFEFKIDVLEFYIDNMLQRYIFENLHKKNNIYQKLESFFGFLLLYKNFLLLIEKNDLIFILNKTLAVNIITIAEFPEYNKEINNNQEIYVIDFITSTICSTITIWVKNGFFETPDMLASLVKTFLSGLEQKSDSLQ